MNTNELYRHLCSRSLEREHLIGDLQSSGLSMSREKASVIADKIIEQFACGKLSSEEDLVKLVELFSAGEIDVYALAKEIRCSVTSACDSYGCRC